MLWGLQQKDDFYETKRASVSLWMGLMTKDLALTPDQLTYRSSLVFAVMLTEVSCRKLLAYRVHTRALMNSIQRCNAKITKTREAVHTVLNSQHQIMVTFCSLPLPYSDMFV